MANYENQNNEIPTHQSISVAEHFLRAAFYGIIWSKVEYRDRLARQRETDSPDDFYMYDREKILAIERNGKIDMADEEFFYAFCFALLECAVSPDNITTPVYEEEHTIFCYLLSYLYEELEVEEKMNPEYWLSEEGLDNLSATVEEFISALRYRNLYKLIDHILKEHPNCFDGYYATHNYLYDPPLSYFQIGYKIGNNSDGLIYQWFKYRIDDEDTPPRTAKSILKKLLKI